MRKHCFQRSVVLQDSLDSHQSACFCPRPLEEESKRRSASQKKKANLCLSIGVEDLLMSSPSWGEKGQYVPYLLETSPTERWQTCDFRLIHISFMIYDHITLQLRLGCSLCGFCMRLFSVRNDTVPLCCFQMPATGTQRPATTD